MAQSGIPATSRIWVALDDAECGLAALDAAAILASRLRAELRGLFVEDINLLRLARLPFSQVVGRASASWRPLDAAELERQLRGQAARSRALLSRLAERERLSWSFHVARGELVAETLTLSSQGEWVIFGKTWKHLDVDGLAPPSQAAVVAVLDGRAPVEPVLRAARYLRDNPGDALTVVITAEPADAIARLRSQAADWLAEDEGRARFAQIPTQDLTAWIARRPGAVVVGGLVSLQPVLQRLLMETASPLVLLH